MKLDGFLVAMAAAVVAAIAAPSIGANTSPVPWSVISLIGVSLIFLLNGANLSRQALRTGAANWRLHLFIQSSTFIFFPLIGLALYWGTAPWLPQEVRLGFFYLGALSSTVSSAIATISIARGDIAAAIFNATLSGLIGMVLTPLLVSLVQAQALGTLSPGEAILDIATKLLLPFSIGHLLRPWIGGLVARYKPWTTKLDRGVIVLIIYTAFCNSTQGGIWSRFSALILLGVAVLILLWLALALSATVFASRWIGFSKPEEITAVICGSQKSLVNGAPIANVLFGSGPSLGAILLPLMLYHPLQLIACSILARRYADRSEAPELAPAQN
jgi:solute carrier family 10 (sodium/bile acid cotransporter), member 7